MFFKQLFQSSTARLSLIAMVLCAIPLLGARSTGAQAKAVAAQAATSPQNEQNNPTTAEMAPNAPSDFVTVNCTVADVGLNYGDNIAYIHGTNCTPSTGAIEFFGVGADTKKANQLLSIGLTAIATGKRAWFHYDSNDTNVPHPESSRMVLNFGLLSQ